MQYLHICFLSQLLWLCDNLWLIGTCFEGLYSPDTMRYKLIPNSKELLIDRDKYLRCLFH